MEQTKDQQKEGLLCQACKSSEEENTEEEEIIMAKKKRTKRKRRTRRRRRRKSELDSLTKFTVRTGNVLVQTSAVMGIARVASNVMNP